MSSSAYRTSFLMLHSCVRLFGHSRCCRSTGFANRRWALLLLTRRPLRVFVRRSLLTPDGPCLSVWVQSLACGVFVRRALRTPDGPFLSVWVQNLACGVCVCVCHSRGVCVCVILGVAVLCVCVLCCVWVCRVCVLPLRAPWQLGRLGSSADVGTATQLPKPRKEAGTPAKQCAPSLPDGAAAAQTMQPRLLHRPCSPGAAPKGRTACTMAPSRPLLAERSSPVMSSSGRGS